MTNYVLTSSQSPAIDSFIKPISEYGIMIVIAAVFIGIVVMVFNSILSKAKKNSENQQEFFQKMMQQSLSQNREMFEHILTSLDAGHHSEEECENEGINLQINDILTLIRDKTSCDHAALFLFHNGGRDLTGRPFQNMSCTNEIVSTKGITPFMKDMQRIPRLSMTSITSGIKRDGFLEIKSIQDLSQKDPSTMKIFEEYKTRSVYAYAIKNMAGYIIGFMLLTFVFNDPDETLNYKEILERYSLKLEGLMLSKDFKAADLFKLK